ncbi:MAG: SBBP repeat-containing protein, partial [Terriglobales bacterium]
MPRWKLPCFAAPWKLSVPCLLALGAAAAMAQAPLARPSQLPLSFEANQGQTSTQAQFLARSHGSIVFLTARGMVVKTRTGAVALQFLGAAAGRAQGVQPLSGRVHYFLGRRSFNVPRFAQVRYAGMYPGVGLRYYGHSGLVEFDLQFAPHAAPSLVGMKFQGATPRLASDGSLQLADGLGLLAPHAYQNVNGRRRNVSAAYRIEPNHTVRLALGTYDTNLPLTVDPVLKFASLLGGTGYNQANAVAVDSSGNGYIAGYTLSSDFPTLNPYQGTLSPGQSGPDYDAFVSEISADGTKLIFSTYLGGTGDDRATGIALDSSDAIYVTGYTSSTDFPGASTSTIQASNHGDTDAFVTKLAPGGASLDYSTYLGGSLNDQANGIAVDSSGDAFIVGTTSSTDFPVSVSAAQKTEGGSTDAFVAGVNPAGSALLFATYLGGSGADRGNAIALGPTGTVYVGGATASTNFPVGGGSQTTNGGGSSDGFVAQVNTSGTFGWVTYLGGNGADEINAIATDTAGNVYVAGDTTSANMFCPSGGCGATLGANGDGFAAKLNNADTTVQGVYLGASPGGVATSIAVDNSGNIYLGGYTSSSNLAVTTNATQSASGGVQDGFLVKYDSTLGLDQKLPLFFTYLGGSGNDQILGIGMQLNGDFDVVGETASANFPVTTGAYQTKFNSTVNAEAFVSRYVVAAQGVFSPPAMGFPAQAPTVASAAQSVTFSNGGELPLIISKIATTGPYTETDTCSANSSTLFPGDSCTISVVFTPTATGSQSGTLVVSDNSPSGSEMLPLSGSGGDFSLTVSPTSATVAAGSSGAFALEVSPA